MVTLSVQSEGSAITVHVTDQGGGTTIPTVADEDPFAERGRGLRLLRMLTKEWDVEINEDTGTVTVCFTIDADHPSVGWECGTLM
jgi:anti-sigma regulatory factor (Ser/Thr protein kinase)